MSAAKRKAGAKSTDFHSTIAAIEQLVEKLENNDTPLESALDHFEQGILLIRQAQAQLSAAEQKVQLLTGQNDEHQPGEPQEKIDSNGVDF